MDIMVNFDLKRNKNSKIPQHGHTPEGKNSHKFKIFQGLKSIQTF